MVWGKSLEPFLISSTISPALTRQLSLQLAGLTYDKRSPEVPLCCTGNNIFKRKGLSCCSSCSPLVMLRCSTAPTFLCGIPLRCVLCHFFAVWQLEGLDFVFQLTCSISLSVTWCAKAETISLVMVYSRFRAKYSRTELELIAKQCVLLMHDFLAPFYTLPSTW